MCNKDLGGWGAIRGPRAAVSVPSSAAGLRRELPKATSTGGFLNTPGSATAAQRLCLLICRLALFKKRHPPSPKDSIFPSSEAL